MIQTAPQCDYGSEKIAELVDQGFEAALERVVEGGMNRDKLLDNSSVDNGEFQAMLTATMDRYACSITKAGVVIRWNQRAVRLFAEVLSVGFMARKNYDDDQQTTSQIRTNLVQLRRIVNSATHCDDFTAPSN